MHTPDPFELQRPGLLRHAQSRIGPNDAPDLVQDALTTASRQQQRASSRAIIERVGLAQWLYALLDHLCDWYLYEKARRGELLTPPDILLDLLDADSSADLTAQAQQAERDALYALLDRIHLTGLQEQCVRLWLDDHSQRQIAAYLMLDVSTVRDHLRAVKRKLARARRLVRTEPGPHWFAEISRVPLYHAPPSSTDAKLVRAIQAYWRAHGGEDER